MRVPVGFPAGHGGITACASSVSWFGSRTISSSDGTFLLLVLWVWHSSEIESPNNAFDGMSDPKVWLVDAVEEAPGSSGGFASATCMAGPRAGLVSESC